jgi:hypothetical protein
MLSLIHKFYQVSDAPQQRRMSLAVSIFSSLAIILILGITIQPTGWGLAGLTLVVGGILALIGALVLPATLQPLIGHLIIGNIVSVILGFGCTMITVIIVLLA